jgi:hypothetical protein
MDATMLPGNKRPTLEHSMARQNKKAPSRPIRVYSDLADLLLELAEAFGEDVATFVDAPLRQYADAKRPDAAKRMEAKAKKIMGNADDTKPRRRGTPPAP